MKHSIRMAIAIVAAVSSLTAEAALQRGRSPAAAPRPERVTPQTYPDADVQAGEGRFVAHCGFCHGRDTLGGEGGPDLTRSLTVAEDVFGDRLGLLMRPGASDGVHDFDLEDDEVRVIVAYVHARKVEADQLMGGRQFVDAGDLRTGDPAAGERYFNGTGRCSTCHSPTGDLAGIASRFEGLDLLRRMLSPEFGRPGPAPPRATVTGPDGQTVSGDLRYRDEFRIELTAADGQRHSFATAEVEYTFEDPLEVHFEQLGRYTDRDMHDVFAYLETLR